jgi:hypothetical protein
MRNNYNPMTVLPPRITQQIIEGIAIACAFILMCQYIMWYVALALLLVWAPYLVQTIRRLIKTDVRLALYLVFLVFQSIHFTEHVAQMVQIHLLGRPFSLSHGLFGAVLDTEWLHFFFDSLYIPFFTLYLLWLYGYHDRWMWILVPLAAWHCAEHVVIMNYYLRTGIVGSPGILAQGGLIGSPLSRPDLHFLYNAAEELFIALGLSRKYTARATGSMQKGRNLHTARCPGSLNGQK